MLAPPDRSPTRPAGSSSSTTRNAARTLNHPNIAMLFDVVEQTAAVISPTSSPLDRRFDRK